MSERSDQIRKWCLKQPRPYKVSVTTVDGDIKDVHCGKAARWRDVAETIDALDPAQLEAYSESDELIRAEKVGEQTAAAKRVEAQQNAVPELPSSLHEDAETARVMHFAGLIARAYEHSTNVAFDKLVQMHDRAMQRMDNIEAKFFQTQEDYWRERDERIRQEYEAAQQQGQGDDFISNFMSGHSQAKQEQQPQQQPAPRPPASGFGMNGKGQA